jgi:Uma2 family endonuclease
MTSLPPWAADPGSLTLTEAQYDALPDRVRKLIEFIDGNVIFCPGGTPEHAELTRTLAIRLDAARPAQPCTRVYTGADVHFTKRRRSDGTLSFRRPDISVSRCTDKDARLFARDALMVVEVVTPASGYTDTVDKLAEYAYEGIPLYLLAFPLPRQDPFRRASSLTGLRNGSDLLKVRCPYLAPHSWDLSTSNSQPGEDGSKPCSISQRAASRLRSDHPARITSRSTSVP